MFVSYDYGVESKDILRILNFNFLLLIHSYIVYVFTVYIYQLMTSLLTSYRQQIDSCV